MALVDSIIGAESGGNADARNPNSSAGGLGQFIDATWLAMLAKHRPDLQGSPDQLLALKSDPQLSREMTEAYAADNGKILTGAGYEASPGNTYLAHFAGPQGAVKVLSADPNASVSDILGAAAVKANPFLQGMTAADLQAWAARKMGVASQPTQPQNAQTSPAGPANRVPAPSVAQQAPSAPMSAPSGGNLFSQMPASQMSAPPPIFYAQRKPIDLSKLQAALSASGNRGLFFSKEG